MIFGMDYLAGRKYLDVIKRAHPRQWAIGGFAETFGDFMPVALWACQNAIPLIRIQMLWSDVHKFGDKDIPKIKKYSKAFFGIFFIFCHSGDR